MAEANLIISGPDAEIKAQRFQADCEISFPIVAAPASAAILAPCWRRLVRSAVPCALDVLPR
jgi:hypothetical protein